MRALVLLRGAPGSGKSTWLKKQGLEDYALCADRIRLMFQSPVMDNERHVFQISQKNDRQVWDLLFQLLEKRMERGELCIVDACHSKSQDFARYKKLIEAYRYRMFCIDFSSVPLDVCSAQNASRQEHKIVSNEVLENIYSRFRNQSPPSYCKTISYDDQASIDLLFKEWKPLDASQYDEIVVIGDVHGCFNPLEKWFREHPLTEKTLHIFVGDYIDRGLENDKVVEWLLENYQKKNVILLEGNHEKWLREFADGAYDEELALGKKSKCRSSEFFERTSKQLMKFDKKELRQLCRKFQAIALVDFDGEEILVTHAGVGFKPKSLMLAAADNFIRSNEYEVDVDEQFERSLTDERLIQIHGHRNAKKSKIDAFPRSLNLCDEVEFGGSLRVVTLKRG